MEKEGDVERKEGRRSQEEGGEIGRKHGRHLTQKRHT